MTKKGLIVEPAYVRAWLDHFVISDVVVNNGEASFYRTTSPQGRDIVLLFLPTSEPKDGLCKWTILGEDWRGDFESPLYKSGFRFANGRYIPYAEVAVAMLYGAGKIRREDYLAWNEWIFSVESDARKAERISQLEREARKLGFGLVKKSYSRAQVEQALAPLRGTIRFLDKKPKKKVKS